MDKISRYEAFCIGETRYFTGEPCSKGHKAERYVKSGACVVCQKEAYKKHAAKKQKGQYVTLTIENIHNADATKLKAIADTLKRKRKERNK